MKLQRMIEAPISEILILIEMPNGSSAWVSASPTGSAISCRTWHISHTGWTVGADCEGWKVFDNWGDELAIGVLGWIPAPEITP